MSADFNVKSENTKHRLESIDFLLYRFSIKQNTNYFPGTTSDCQLLTSDLFTEEA